jgi:hypothetical protein
MSRSVINLAICLVLMGYAPVSQAQDVRAATDTDGTSCAFNFGSDTANTLAQFCVAETGNITRIETPLGREMVHDGVGSDGYGLCNLDSGISSYSDYGVNGDSVNLGSPVLLSRTAMSVEIARTTSDGIWTLTQTISLVPATPAIQVAVALKNNTAVPITAYLPRYSDINVDSGVFNDEDDLSATENSAFEWIATVPFAGNFGTVLQLQNVGNSQFGFVSGYARTTLLGPNPCNFAKDSSATPVVDTDGSVVLTYVDTIAAEVDQVTIRSDLRIAKKIVGSDIHSNGSPMVTVIVTLCANRAQPSTPEPDGDEPRSGAAGFLAQAPTSPYPTTTARLTTTSISVLERRFR